MSKDRIVIAESCRERFFDQHQFPRFRDWQIFLGGLSILKQQYVIQRQTSGYHMVVLTQSGEGVLKKAGENDVLLKPGSVLLVPAQSSIHYELSQLREWQMAWFMLEPANLWHQFPAQVSLLEQFQWHKALSDVLGSLSVENIYDDDDSQALQRLYCEQIYLLIHRAIKQVHSPVSESNQRLRSVLHEIEVSPDKPWTIEQLCEFTHYSRAQLNRLFQMHVGCSPSRKVTQIKMNYAALMLRSTELPVKQVGHVVGFDNAYNFSNRFKQIVGCSPSLYRNRHQLVC